MKIRKDISGERFGRLTAVKPVSKKGNGITLWLCKCDCGSEHITTITCLTTGDCKSCGCLKHEISKEVKHGQANTRIYHIWQNMKSRCRNKNNPRYKDYGKRGIDYCEEWEKFENFYEWAISQGYSKELTIDRIDNDGNYEPSNCRWATTREQQYNKRTTHFVTFKGETKSMAEWAKTKNMSLQTLAARLNTYHWPVEKALETPVKERRRN